MISYGQFCPVAQASKLLCERWTLIVVRELIAGGTRFTQLKKGVPLMSPSLLSSRLKQLAKAGVIDIRGDKGDRSYTLTPAGRELRPLIEMLGAWGHRWAPSNLSKGDLDAGLLMWDMRRSVDPEVFPRRRIVVQFEYPDAPNGGRHWWLVSENGEIDLCSSDPGYDVDILIKSALRAITSVWICQQTFREAVKKGDINVSGDSRLISKLQDWLRSSPLARLGTLGDIPEVAWKTG